MSAWKRVAVVWSVVKGDVRLLWRALRHPDAPRWLKIGAAGLVLYLISPVDLVPEAVPFLGIMDDIVIVPMALRWMLSRLPPQLRKDIGEAAVNPQRTA